MGFVLSEKASCSEVKAHLADHYNPDLVDGGAVECSAGHTKRIKQRFALPA